MTHFAAGSPILIEAVAGLALLNAFGSALHNALVDSSEREAALATFLVASSGVGFYGDRRRVLGAAGGRRDPRAHPRRRFHRLQREASQREQHLRAGLGGDVGRIVGRRDLDDVGADDVDPDAAAQDRERLARASARRLPGVPVPGAKPGSRLSTSKET